MVLERLDRTPVGLSEAVDHVDRRLQGPSPGAGDLEMTVGDRSRRAGGGGGAVASGPVWATLSGPERKAREDLLIALRDGDLHAKGRHSDTPAAPWELPHRGRRWMLHSGHFSPIPPEAWRAGDVDWPAGTLTLAEGQFIDIRLPRFMLDAIWSGTSRYTEADGPLAEERYTTPYLDLLRRAIPAHRITADRQPKKEVLVEWFREQVVEGEAISANLASAMATLVRLPSSRKGGNRKWR